MPDFVLNLKSVLKFKVIDLPRATDTEDLKKMMKLDRFVPVTDEFKDELGYVCESILASIFPNAQNEDDLSLDLDTILQILIAYFEQNDLTHSLNFAIVPVACGSEMV